MLVFDFSVIDGLKKLQKQKQKLPTLPHQLIPYDSSADLPLEIIRKW